jgi:hypothetical protein
MVRVRRRKSQRISRPKEDLNNGETETKADVGTRYYEIQAFLSRPRSNVGRHLNHNVDVSLESLKGISLRMLACGLMGE